MFYNLKARTACHYYKSGWDMMISTMVTVISREECCLFFNNLLNTMYHDAILSLFSMFQSNCYLRLGQVL